MRRAPARPVRACFVRSCCSVVIQEHDPRATPVQCNVKQTLSAPSHCTFHTPHSPLHTCTSSQLSSSELFSSHFISSHMSAKFFLAIFMSSERSSNFLISPELVSTHLGSSARQKAWDTDACYTACTEYSPVVLEETPFTSFTVSRWLYNAKRSCIASNLNRKSFVNTTYCKHGVVVICQSDSRIAQSTSQYYVVLQSLHKLLPSTTVHYKACTKHFPVLLCTTKLAQTTSQYYFALQSLHKSLPSTAL